MAIDNRRHFLKRFAGGVAALYAAPSALRWESSASSLALRDAAASLPPGPVEDEEFWRLVKGQFSLDRDLILMNAANLCPSPYVVQETVFGLTREVDADASGQNRAKFGELREKSHAALAAYLGASADEIAIVRNTTEANNIVVNGLDLGAGDEVVIWDQNHATNSVSWDVRASRHGFTVRRVTTPTAPQSAEDLMRPFREALTSRTRVLAITHVSNVTGVALPATELCTLARQRGILTLLDGAQTFGFRKLDLHAIGCDFYTGSAHKWFMGPKEAGVLYVRQERALDLWPSYVGVGWEGARERGARRFETLGQRDDAAVAAMAPTVEFHQTVGVERVEARVRALATQLKTLLKQAVPDAQFATPMQPELSGGVVILAIPGVSGRDAIERLYREHHVGGAATGGMRLCPHVYTTMDDMTRVAEAVVAVRG